MIFFLPFLPTYVSTTLYKVPKIYGCPPYKVAKIPLLPSDALDNRTELPDPTSQLPQKKKNENKKTMRYWKT